MKGLDSVDELITIDPVTANVSTIGPLGTDIDQPTVAGLAWDRSADVLFFSDGASLYTVDPTSGATTRIGEHGANLTKLGGLAFLPEPSTLVMGVTAILAMLVILLGRCRRSTSVA